ncbi:hypothetical protein [Mycolicibacterium mageritense]|uniref:hypothetical protein n=1 Tax=Mycolicibacterium mageritense TaxID=53462 RepID=UPI001E580A4B|nr:hypothetical protein [Mycolicibacterium mageritense]GJJ22955.1 hypothetical protein MTY414_66280 [Mycolicibacterium mageritense]
MVTKGDKSDVPGDPSHAWQPDAALVAEMRAEFARYPAMAEVIERVGEAAAALGRVNIDDLLT